MAGGRIGKTMLSVILGAVGIVVGLIAYIAWSLFVAVMWGSGINSGVPAPNTFDAIVALVVCVGGGAYFGFTQGAEWLADLLGRKK